MDVWGSNTDFQRFAAHGRIFWLVARAEYTRFKGLGLGATCLTPNEAALSLRDWSAAASPWSAQAHVPLGHEAARSLTAALREDRVRVYEQHRPPVHNLPLEAAELTDLLADAEPEPEPHWIEVRLVDEHGEPWQTEPYRVLLSDRSELEGSLDSAGIAQIPSAQGGPCEWFFPSLPPDGWGSGSSAFPHSSGAAAAAAAEHTAAQGETLASIAIARKVPYRSVLHAPQNEALLQRRTPEQLFEGDIVFIPEAPPKSVILEVDRVHTLVVRPPRVPLQVQFLCGGAPRGLEPCTLRIDDENPVEEMLDADGWLRTEVSAVATQLHVTFFPDTAYAEEATLQLGHLDPVSETRGVQQRLNNLGFECGAEDGDAAERTQAALRAFQATTASVPPSGTACPQTMAALTELHRS